MMIPLNVQPKLTRILLIVVKSHESENSDAENPVIQNQRRSINMPICIDDFYNLIVCKDCVIGIPIEYISGHLSDNHGIKATETQVMTYLDLETRPMTVAQARNWMSEA